MHTLEHPNLNAVSNALKCSIQYHVCMPCQFVWYVCAIEGQGAAGMGHAVQGFAC